jgi:hypothetical protein
MKKTLGKIVLVYYLIYIVAIAAVALGYLILKNGVAVDVKSEAGITLQSFVILYIMASVPFALYFFNKMTKKWQLIEDEEEKLKIYAKWAIIRLLAVGLGLFAGVILYYLMRSPSMLFCAGIAAVGLFFCKPAKSKIENELNLNNSNQ